MSKIDVEVKALFKEGAELTELTVQALLDKVAATAEAKTAKIQALLDKVTEDSRAKIEKLEARIAEIQKDPSTANQCLETIRINKKSYRFKKGILKLKVPMRILPEGFKPEGMNAAGELSAEDAIQCKELMTALVKVNAGIIEEAE